MSPTRRLLALARPHARSLAAGIALSVLVTLSNVALLALSGWFIVAMALFGLHGTRIEYFAPAAAIRGLALLRTGGRYAERLVSHDATLRLLATHRTWLYAALEPLAPARLQFHRGGDLMTRLRADVDSLENLYLRVLVPVTAAAVTTTLMVGFLFLYDRTAALTLAIGLLCAGLLCPLAAGRAGRHPGETVVRTRADLGTEVATTLRGLGELMLFDALPAREAEITAAGRALEAAQRRQSTVAAVLNTLPAILTTASVVATLFAAADAVRAGRLTGPELAMAVFLALAALEAVAVLPAALHALGETRAAARRIFALVDAEPAVVEPAHPAPSPATHDIRLRGLCLRYPDKTDRALDRIDLDIPRGARIGLAGESGAGKSSVLNVLLRFWEFDEGEATISGVSIRALGGDGVRALCSVVAQSTHLFNGSIAENLRLARPDAPDEALFDALRHARLADEVTGFERGLDTVVGENGARLSGGQARRLAIARAFLKDAPILLLDEPTEGLDPASERAVMDALRTLMRGRTTIVVSHRTEALRDLDSVYYLSAGRIVSRQDAGEPPS